MIKLFLIFIAFFLGYFVADLKLIYIPYEKMPYLEKLYERVEK